MNETIEIQDDAPASILPAPTPPLTALAEALGTAVLPGPPSEARTTNLAALRGARMVALFSTAEAELSALTTGVGTAARAAAFDQGARVRLRITGEDRVRWLNGMVTNTVKALGTGTHNYTFVLNAQGRIQADATVYALADHLILETDHAQAAKLFEHLDRFIIMDDVELTWVERQTTLGVAGPGAGALLTSLGLPVPAPGTFSALTSESSILVVAGDEGSAFSLWISNAHVAAVWQQLLDAGALPAGARAVEAFRILAGTPLYGVDFGERTLAQETGQARALNFNKGCYLGQEIVERIRSRATVHRGIRQFALQGEPSGEGAPLTVDGAVVGELTSIARVDLPGFPQQVALGTVRVEAIERGSPLRYAGGTAQVLAVPALPGTRAPDNDGPEPRETH